MRSQLGGTTLFVGGYTLVALQLSGATEGSNSLLAPGVPVTGQIDPAGDFDFFSFTYQAGTPLDLLLTGGAGSSGNGFSAGVTDSAWNDQGVITSSGVPTGRFMLPHSGTYWVPVNGNSRGLVVTEVGGYSLLLRTVTTQPETASPLMALDDSITTEAIDSRLT